MSETLRYLGQGLIYLVTALVLGYFSNAPAYVHFPPDQALIKLSLVHSAQPKESCRRLSAQEIADLAPNMRKAVSCPRERSALWIELLVDGQMRYQESRPPTGLSGDGPARVYRKIVVEPGRHHLVMRLRDSRRSEGYDYQHETEVELRSRQNLVIDFRAETGGFLIR
jgi:hypothetical protein